MDKEILCFTWQKSGFVFLQANHQYLACLSPIQILKNINLLEMIIWTIWNLESKNAAVGYLFLLPIIGTKKSQVNSTTLITTAVKLGGDDDAESGSLWLQMEEEQFDSQETFLPRKH